MATSMLTLEQLPDDVIVVVLQYLPVKDVLDCRLACKRLCILALHWDVWRHRSLEDDNPHAGAVLHLAPCLDKLTVTGRVPTLAVTSTRCAVAGLKLHGGAALDAPEYALAVRNQESLGRLRRLELETTSIGLRHADALVRTVASCSFLESIDVVGWLPDVTHPVVLGPPRPSLTNFRCPLNSHSISFVDTILAGHAATLEKVDLLDVYTSEETRTRTANLLGAMPRLRSLRCSDRLWGLQDVAECKTLTRVHIMIHGDVYGKVETVAKLLRRAKQLRSVHLENGRSSEYCSVSAVLVEALASAGRFHLEELLLEEFDDVRPLLRALPSLPALRHLDLYADSAEEPNDELLESITPATAPALRLLEIGEVTQRCPHAWIHGAAVKATLAENPSLHILLWYTNRDKCVPQDCEACVTGCHREIKWGVRKCLGLYSHQPDKCPSLEYHTDDPCADSWIHV
ncbi:uncharacterized protein LOC113202668 [Frankliniella occidentalis]|uniref:Uncharacterized protein LOC113202668 n=1 Tax=Frankliniella occidentalis TaxID=133901 RepID=A0A6J1RWU6_FRAOC|nr:uncharacterized protein LOC113202668 [Frankliniella occidentalis]